MIILNLKGGLGNQMFQYAMGRALMEKTGQELKLDLTGYDRNHYRAFGLDNFKIIKNPASPEEIKRVKYPYGLLSKGWRWFAFKILRRHHTGWEPKTLTRIIKKLETGQDVYVDGFWQSYKYFIEIKDILAKELSLKEPLEKTQTELLNKINETNSVAISIRRTDYLLPKNLSYIGICSASYYQKAIALIEEKIKDPTFFVISDDLDWAKETIKTKNSIVWVSEMRKDNTLNYFQEMMLMSKCKHGIIANSSFSWWPTWLNKNPNQVIVTPDVWFTDNHIKINDVAPSSWIKLPRD